MKIIKAQGGVGKALVPATKAITSEITDTFTTKLPELTSFISNSIKTDPNFSGIGLNPRNTFRMWATMGGFDKIKESFPEYDVDVAKRNWKDFGEDFFKKDGSYYLPEDAIINEIAKMGIPERSDFNPALLDLIKDYFKNQSLPLVLENAKTSGVTLSPEQENWITNLYSDPFNGVDVRIGYNPWYWEGRANDSRVVVNSEDPEVLTHEMNHTLRRRLGKYLMLQKLNSDSFFPLKPGSSSSHFYKYPALVSGDQSYNFAEKIFPAYFDNELKLMEPLSMPGFNFSPTHEIGTVASEHRFNEFLKYIQENGVVPDRTALNESLANLPPKYYYDTLRKMSYGPYFGGQAYTWNPNEGLFNNLYKQLFPKKWIGKHWKDAVMGIGSFSGAAAVNQGAQDQTQEPTTPSMKKGGSIPKYQGAGKIAGAIAKVVTTAEKTSPIVKSIITKPTSAELLQRINRTMNPYLTESAIYAMRSGDEGIILPALINDADKIDAHGISKGTNQLEQLITLLNEGIDPSRPFYTAPLRVPDGAGVGLGVAGGAYTNGRFILTANPGEMIGNSGIKNVLINDYGGHDGYFVKLQETLQNMFPNYRFIRYSNAPTYFNSLKK